MTYRNQSKLMILKFYPIPTAHATGFLHSQFNTEFSNYCMCVPLFVYTTLESQVCNTVSSSPETKQSFQLVSEGFEMKSNSKDDLSLKTNKASSDPLQR